MTSRTSVRILTDAGNRFGQFATRNLGASIFLVVTAACLLASQDGLVKGLVQDVPMFQLIWLRFLVHSVIMVSVLRTAGKTGILRTKRPGLHAARTLAILATGITMFGALKLMSLATATVILFLNPVLVCLFSTLFLGERIGPRRYLAIFAGFAGVVVVIDPSFDGINSAMLLPLGSAICAATYVMMTRQLSGSEEAMPTMVLCPVGITLLLTPVQFFIWEPLTAAQIGLIAAMGCCAALGHTCLQFGLRGASAAALSPFLYAQVVFAAGLSVLVFGDPMGSNLIVGSLLIVGSGLAIWYFQNREVLAASSKADRGG